MAIDIAARTESVAGFVPVPLDLIRRQSVVEFDLYVAGQRQMVLYRARQLPFTDEAAQRLIDNGVPTLWVRNKDEGALGRYVEDNLNEILADPSVQPIRKGQALYTAARGLAIEILTAPDDEKIARTRPLVSETVNSLMGSPQVLASVLATVATNYQLHTHCVNVCVYAIRFARALGYRDLAVVTEFALGGLLHDIGKAQLPTELLDKPGALNDHEWELMRSHPRLGVEMLGAQRNQMGQAAEAIYSHHERWDGGGYPEGIAGPDIPLAARIVAIADAFDALTSVRTYRQAFRPYDALVTMRDEPGGKYDPTLLKRFVVIWGPEGHLTA